MATTKVTLLVAMTHLRLLGMLTIEAMTREELLLTATLSTLRHRGLGRRLVPRPEAVTTMRERRLGMSSDMTTNIRNLLTPSPQ